MKCCKLSSCGVRSSSSLHNRVSKLYYTLIFLYYTYFVLGDPIDFLSWFLNALHRALNGNKKKDSSIIYKSFLGNMKIYTRKIPSTDLNDKEKKTLLATAEYQEVITESPFLYLTCDLPPPPLFIDEFRENIIPQVREKEHIFGRFYM